MQMFKRITCIMIMLLLSAAPNSVSYAEEPPPELSSDGDIGCDINGEAAPGSEPQKSRWYRLKAREIISEAIVSSTGLDHTHSEEYPTVLQAVTIASYMQTYLYKDSAYAYHFKEELNKTVMATLSDLKLLDTAINEASPITREQCSYLIIHLINVPVKSSAIDPTAPGIYTSIESYSDYDAVTPCYRASMQSCLSLGYINGTSDTYELLPGKYADLRDLNVMLERAFHLHYAENYVKITAVQLNSLFSHLNRKFLHIPTYMLNVLVKIIGTLLCSEKFLSYLLGLLRRKKHAAHA